MQKHIFFLLIFIFESLLSNAQSTGVITYQYRSKLPDGIANGKTALYFDATRSLFRHEQLPKKDSIVEKGMMVEVFHSDPEGFSIYKDLRKSISIAKHKAWVGKRCYAVEDTLPKIKWQISEQTKTIGDYTCTRATGIFGGRRYEVWFADEIPVSSGPHRLWGLPGLIFEARSDDGAVSFSFAGIRFSADAVQQIAPTKQYDQYFIGLNSFAAHQSAEIKQKEKMFNATMKGEAVLKMNAPGSASLIEKYP